MIPTIPNLKEHWVIDSKQIQDLDENILLCYPNAKLSEGIKYGRWAQIDNESPVSVFSQKYAPDNVFDGKIMGKDTKIFMWLPLFN